MTTATVSVDIFGYVRGLLASRGITDYYLDVYRWVIPAGRRHHNTGGERALYYLLPQPLPAGAVLISDTWALRVGAQINESKVKEQARQEEAGVRLGADIAKSRADNAMRMAQLAAQAQQPKKGPPTK